MSLRPLPFVLSFALLFAACEFVDGEIDSDDLDEESAGLIRASCGDGYCSKWDGEQMSCPADCFPSCAAGEANTEACNRDRLLDSLANRMNAVTGSNQNRCSVWSGWSTNQKEVFYTITDMLAGSYVKPPPVEFRYRYNGCCAQGAPCDPSTLPVAGDVIYNQATGEGPGIVRMMYSVPYAGTFCLQVGWPMCYDPRGSGACSIQQVARPISGDYAEDMLDNTEELYAMAPSTSACGGGTVNRLYFGGTSDLMSAMRSIGSPWGYPSAPANVPAWRRSGDLAGPHSPFTSSLETADGQPRGQNHFFAGAAHVVPVNKPGFVETITADNLIEMDIDYNWIHDSNPICSYSGQTGRYRYDAFWGARGWPTEDVFPTGCP